MAVLMGLAEAFDKVTIWENYSFKNAMLINSTLRDCMIYTYIKLKENVEMCIAFIGQEFIKLV